MNPARNLSSLVVALLLCVLAILGALPVAAAKPPAAPMGARVRLASGAPGTTYLAASFPDPTHGFVLTMRGSKSLVLSTVDGGRQWSRHALPFTLPNGFPTAFQFVDPTDGWVMGGRCDGCRYPHTAIFATTDGARSWRRITLPDPTLLDFVSPSAGWATGSQCPDSRDFGINRPLRVCRTTDGGRTWFRAHWGFNRVFSFHFATAATGWATGVHRGVSGVYLTHDGGRSWVRSMRFTRDIYASEVSFAGRDGWLVTENGAYCSEGGCVLTYQRTLDGGRSWQTVPFHGTMARGFIAGLTFFDANHGWLVISAGAGIGIGGVATTSDGGARWRASIQLHCYRTLADLSLAVTGPTSAWLAGGDRSLCHAPSTLLHTIDLGHHWRVVLP